MNPESKLCFDDDEQRDEESETAAVNTSADSAQSIRAKALSQHPSKAERRSDHAETITQQKQRIRREYAAEKWASKKTADAVEYTKETQTTRQKVKELEYSIKEFLTKNKTAVCVVLCLAVVLVILALCISSCSMLAETGLSALTSGTYPSSDEAMLGAEAAYAAKEAALQTLLDNYESDHNYDEYVYELDSIGHNPYTLISLLTAYHGGAWTLAEVQDTLEMIFNQQYVLTETVTTEPRTDAAGTPYDCTICTVNLENKDLDRIVPYLLNEDQLSAYSAYISNYGNYPDLFPVSEYPNAVRRGDYQNYEIPPEALSDDRFRAMITEAEKYLGYPYVWGGSSPSTSFDCSGFISWVINHSGWNVGRLGAKALYNICTPISPENAEPGDLIFFWKTYDAPDPNAPTHVGLYVGNNMMIHCGNPISYTSISTNYWQSHFFGFGRLP